LSGYSLTDILTATNGKVLIKGAEYFTGISTDSRSIHEGEFFIALKGKRFDGHKFINQALKKGSGAMIQLYPYNIQTSGKSIIYVNNTLKALHAIARFKRFKSKVKVIGITGTNGKTTTKEMIASVLSKKYNVLKSKGNMNNQIGLALSLTKLRKHDIAVLEMGASYIGDIKELCGIAFPQIGVITNIGLAHLSSFGSLVHIRDTKLEILDFVQAIVINKDDPMLSQMLNTKLFKGKEIITFGFSKDAFVSVEKIKQTLKGVSFYLKTFKKNFKIELSVFGMFNVYNALAAVATCILIGAEEKDIVIGLKEFRGVPMRFEIKKFLCATVINDLYNANPTSMEESLKEFINYTQMNNVRRIVVLGDMLELGADSEIYHRKIGRYIATMPIDIFIAVGEQMFFAYKEFINLNKEKIAYSVKEATEAKEIILSIIKENDIVFIKGSRGMKLEKILEE